MLVALHKSDADEFKTKMSTIFKMTDEGECTFYLGMNIEQREDGILIYQRKYLETVLERFGFQDLPVKSVPIDPNLILETEKIEITTP